MKAQSQQVLFWVTCPHCSAIASFGSFRIAVEVQLTVNLQGSTATAIAEPNLEPIRHHMETYHADGVL